jgi:hypothetical protein
MMAIKQHVECGIMRVRASANIQLACTALGAQQLASNSLHDGALHAERADER